MKILFVAHCTDLSGANKSLLDIIMHLKERNDIYVLVNKSQGKLIDQLNRINIPHIVASFSWWYARGAESILTKIYRYVIDFSRYWSHRLTYKEFIYIKNQNFDCVYTNTSTVDVGAIIARKLNIPHFWHIREYGDKDFHFTRIRSSRYMEKLFKLSSKNIFISYNLFDTYTDKFQIQNGVVIYNGFHISSLRGDCLYGSNKDTSYNLLVTGQVISGKGQEQAIKAVHNLYSRSVPVHLYLAGPVDKNYLDPILKCYQNWTRWLTILGNVDDIYSLRNSMHIELVCSHSEAFGRVTIEAMLHHIPVIGARAGATPELIINNETGLLFTLDDVLDLERKIFFLINNPTIGKLLADNAFHYAEKFSIENTCIKIENLISKDFLNEN